MAVEQARLIDDAELTWDGFREDAIEGAGGDAVLQAASLEPLENRRMLMLRYGCGLRARDIARLLDMPAAQVSGVLTRFSRRLKRRLPPREHARVERAIARSARAWLEKQNGGVPDAGAVYRSLEAELMEAGAPHASRFARAGPRAGHRRRPASSPRSSGCSWFSCSPRAWRTPPPPPPWRPRRPPPRRRTSAPWRKRWRSSGRGEENLLQMKKTASRRGGLCFARPSRQAMVSAISIILVNVFWRSSAGSASPVTRLSEMVSSASAFLPAAAAFR